MVRAPALAVVAALALLGGASPARADQELYQRMVRCAAYDTLAIAVLDSVKDHKDKQAIKRHTHSAGLSMELASGLLDPYHVPRAQVVADVDAFVREQIARMQQGTSFDTIVAEAQNLCVDYTFP